MGPSSSETSFSEINDKDVSDETENIESENEEQEIGESGDVDEEIDNEANEFVFDQEMLGESVGVNIEEPEDQ